MSVGTKIVLCYYFLINVVLFVSMWVDKSKAKKGEWRISESTLFVMALLGGGIGGFLAMYLFHHKNRKLHFYLIYGISIFLHIAVLYFIFAKLI